MKLDLGAEGQTGPHSDPSSELLPAWKEGRPNSHGFWQATCTDATLECTCLDTVLRWPLSRQTHFHTMCTHAHQPFHWSNNAEEKQHCATLLPSTPNAAHPSRQLLARTSRHSRPSSATGLPSPPSRFGRSVHKKDCTKIFLTWVLQWCLAISHTILLALVMAQLRQAHHSGLTSGTSAATVWKDAVCVERTTCLPRSPCLCCCSPWSPEVKCESPSLPLGSGRGTPFSVVLEGAVWSPAQLLFPSRRSGD